MRKFSLAILGNFQGGNLDMKRKFLALMLVMLYASGAWGAYYDEGNDSDSWDTAYIIDSAEDLKLMRNLENSGKYYRLNSDIDLTSETDWEGIQFYGYFDGQNHTIKLNSLTNNLYAALFHRVSTKGEQSAIKNLKVEGNVKGNCAGTIVHYLESGIIENCTFNGTITFSYNSSSFGAGGIVAHQSGGTVRSCRVNANISGTSYAGGIVGILSAGNIENSTVEKGTIITARNVGGIAGEISSSYSGNISGNTWPDIYPLAGKGNYSQDNPTPTPTNPIYTWNNHRYQVLNDALIWEQAKSRCESLGGHLVTIISQAEQSKIEELLSSSQLSHNSY